MQGASYIYILAPIRKKYAEKFGYLNNVRNFANNKKGELE